MALKFPVKEHLDVHCLVIGTGIAGLSVALSLAEQRADISILVASKSDVGDTNTTKAQGGIAAVLSSKDTFEDHIKDTLDAGRGLCDRNAVEQLVTHGPEEIASLVERGMRFDDSLGKEGGHSKRRVAHGADATGAGIQKALIESLRKNPHIKLKENHFCVRLLTAGRGTKKHCTGAVLLDLKDQHCVLVHAQAVLLATGGAGQLWSHTSNPPVATGDGVWLAYEVGAQLADLEFMQFHPTTLAVPSARNFLLTEALRGEGAFLRNERGERFMESYPSQELAPRDVVSQAIWREYQRRGGKVFLDVRHFDPEFLKRRFPTVLRAVKEHGLNPSRDLIPIVPAAHYLCGGIRTDLCGRSSLNGLYAIGECACTGVHGANRLASNSLLEGVVFARAAVRDLTSRFPLIPPRALRTISSIDLALLPLGKSDALRTTLTKKMWQHVSLFRNKEGLERALKEIREIAACFAQPGGPVLTGDVDELRRLLELRGMVGMARLLTLSALFRTESRGCHQRMDFPNDNQDNQSNQLWLQRIVIERGRDPTLVPLVGTTTKSLVHQIVPH